MKKNDKQRLFEVMSRLDKTFKPKLNEDLNVDASAEPSMGSTEELPNEEQEKTPEEKLQELTAKVDELYALLHGEESEEVPAEGTGDEFPENLQEWNFDKKKGEKKEEKPEGKKQFNFDKKEDGKSKEHEDSETPEEEKKEHEDKKELKEEDAPKTKIPVNMVAKVGGK